MSTSTDFVIKKNKPAAQPIKQPEAISTTTTHASSQQLLPSGRFVSHHPNAGVNPLVDNAAYLFSVTGKLKHLKSYRHLNQLQKELIEEINLFQEAAKTRDYSPDFILVSRYALCATLDDIISNASWGSQGQWDSYRLLNVFNNSNESPNYDRFFMILERIIKDPALYIDLMEFMYICLSLGFKGNYRSTEFSHNQLEQITDSLYKRIRSQHGNFSKTLSPYPLQQPPIPKPSQTTSRHSILGVFGLTATIVLTIFIGLGYMLDSISNQAYQELMHIGKSILYETPKSS